MPINPKFPQPPFVPNRIHTTPAPPAVVPPSPEPVAFVPVSEAVPEAIHEPVPEALPEPVVVAPIPELVAESAPVAPVFVPALSSRPFGHPPMKDVDTLHGKKKLGSRRKPVAKCPTLKLKNYLKLSFPTPPASCDYRTEATAALSQMYDNDTLGDCVIAGGYHIVGVLTGNADGGAPFLASNNQILADYSAIGGYVPGDPSTDNGCDEQTALNYWTQTGFADGTKLVGWLSIDATNQQEVEAAMYLFENLFFGLELPDAWVSPFPSASGFTWGVAGAPDPNNGHCVVGVGYTSAGVTIDTWGMTGTMTWAAVAKYCAANVGGELFVLLSPDQINKAQAKSPSGLNWSQLVTDFDNLGGNVPAPVTAPSALSYTSPLDCIEGVAVTDTPTVSGSPTAFSVSPALPAGLSLNPTTGVISGTPKAVDSVTCTVTASNSGGSTTASVTVMVAAPVPVPTPPVPTPPVPTPPVPTPPVPTPPVPTPPVPTVTLAQAQAWAISELVGKRLVTGSQAEALVKRGLAAHWPAHK